MLEEYGVWAEDAVATLDEDHRVIVCLVNGTAQGITLNDQTQVAKATSLPGERINTLSTQDWFHETDAYVEHCNRVNVTTDTEEPQNSRDIGEKEEWRAVEIIRKIDRSLMIVEQRQIVEEAVQQNPRCFALDGEPLTLTTKALFRLDTGDAPPLRKRAYRIPECHKIVLKGIIEKQLEEGMIAPSRSDWCTPIVLIPNKDATQYRLVADHWTLNRVLRRDSYSLPLISDRLDEDGLINKIHKFISFEIHLSTFKSGSRHQFCRFFQSERSILPVSNMRT